MVECLCRAALYRSAVTCCGFYAGMEEVSAAMDSDDALLRPNLDEWYNRSVLHFMDVNIKRIDGLGNVRPSEQRGLQKR
eukprot:6318909-Alexandrium_andersonii.AAC.1